MSAYIVDRATITALVHAALVLEQIDASEASETGQLLNDACVASVRYRYHDESPETLPGAYDPTPFEFPLYSARSWPTPTAGFTLKQLSCYEYQSCETPEWSESRAARFCDDLRRRVARMVDGYEDAPWGVETYPSIRVVR